MIRLLSFSWFSLAVAYDHWPTIQQSAIHHWWRCGRSNTDNAIGGRWCLVRSHEICVSSCCFFLYIFSSLLCITLCTIRGQRCFVQSATNYSAYDLWPIQSVANDWLLFLPNPLYCLLIDLLNHAGVLSYILRQLLFRRYYNWCSSVEAAACVCS